MGNILTSSEKLRIESLKKSADDFFDDHVKSEIVVKKVIRTGEYVDPYSQSFNNVKIQYKLVGKKLVKVGEIDIQAQLNSNRDCALDVILDKFLNTGIVESSYVSGLSLDSFSMNDDDVETVDHEDDLIKLSESIENIEALRKKYNLPKAFNAKQIVSHIINLNNNAVSEINLKVEGLKNEKKKVNEKTINEEFSQNRKQDPQKESS